MNKKIKLPRADRNPLSLNSLPPVTIFPSGLCLRILSRTRLAHYLPLIRIQRHLQKQTLSHPISQIHQLLTMTRNLTFRPSRSPSIMTRIIKARLLMRLMITLNLNLRYLKVHQTARSRSLLSIRLTSPISVLFSRITTAPAGVISAVKAYLGVATRLSAATATMMNALSAARRIGSTS
jgi:hypothetical protein